MNLGHFQVLETEKEEDVLRDCGTVGTILGGLLFGFSNQTAMLPTATLSLPNKPRIKIYTQVTSMGTPTSYSLFPNHSIVILSVCWTNKSNP